MKDEASPNPLSRKAERRHTAGLAAPSLYWRVPSLPLTNLSREPTGLG